MLVQHGNDSTQGLVACTLYLVLLIRINTYDFNCIISTAKCEQEKSLIISPQQKKTDSKQAVHEIYVPAPLTPALLASHFHIHTPPHVTPLGRLQYIAFGTQISRTKSDKQARSFIHLLRRAISICKRLACCARAVLIFPAARASSCRGCCHHRSFSTWCPSGVPKRMNAT